jgi:2-keto-4-pentenoate hydratase/2-oxohepta-3-ene-1,7-dioic acid hydratase in catechol pathway
MDYIAGLTILNDLSARDLMKRYDVPFLFDWIGQKCFEGAAPTGPWITPLENIDDPCNLDIKLWVNGRLFQDSNSNQMIFNHAELVAYLSQHITLYPGDIIATGTPAGVGHGQGEYLKPGDVVEVEIDGLGRLRTEFS